MRYFSTFSGIAGFELGINRADPEAECVGYSEIDKYAVSVYEKHNPGVHNYGDITQINAEELPDFDCLVGGFPCQAFSIAGKRRGFDDIRGTLFFDLARILRAKQPRLFVFENVKGLLSHSNGQTFRTIIATIDELGYDCQWQVLNSKNHGVPQNRERVYIVGHLRGTPRPEVFPIGGTHRETIEPGSGNKITIPVLTPDRIVKRQNGRRFKTNGEPAFTVNTQDRHGVLQLNQPTHSNDRVYNQEGISPTLNTMQGGNRQPFISKTVRAGGRSSPHGSKQNWDSYEVGNTIRRLTPLECERLQGFPDNWTAIGSHGVVSDTQRYKMCGNAVTTNVVQAVFERILA